MLRHPQPCSICQRGDIATINAAFATGLRAKTPSSSRGLSNGTAWTVAHSVLSSWESRRRFTTCLGRRVRTSKPSINPKK